MRLTAVVPAFAALLLAAACGPTQTTGNNPDAAIVRAPDGRIISPTDAGAGTDGNVSNPDAATVACSPKGTAASGKQHNPGQDCMNCHGNEFSVAGTMYTAASGGSVLNGATVTIVDAAGVTQKAVSGTQGNFWLRTNVTFPVTITSSLCPNTHVMVAKAQDGACNQSGCHTSGGQGRIHP